MRIYRFVYVDTLDVPIPILFNTPSHPELINHKILIMIKKEKKKKKKSEN